MKKIFLLCVSAFLIFLAAPRSAWSASTEKLTQIVFSYLTGSNGSLNGRSWYGPPISEYAYRSSLKRVALPAFEDETEQTLLSLVVDDLADRGYRGPSVGLTFLTMLSNNYGNI